MSDESSSSSQKTCGLCNEKASKYCCPRCEVLYCSLDCYKSEKHSTCSETFYRECVNEELASYQPDDESRQKMVEILKRLRNEDVGQPEMEELLENVEYDDQESIDSDDNEETDLHDRIKGLNLNDADAIWNALTEDERNDFEALLNQGDVGSILPHWDPWWTYKKEEKLVNDVDKQDNELEKALKRCPMLKDVPKLSTLTTVQPSPAIKYNIINILASYAFVTRYFNGELDPVETTIYVLNICANLDSNANFDGIMTALESVAQKCQQSELIETDELSLEVMKHDTLLILQGPSAENKLYYCKAVLSHLLYIFNEAKSKTKSNKPEEKSKEKSIFSKKFPDHSTEHLPKLDVSKLKKCVKKVEYLMSYIENHGMDLE